MASDIRIPDSVTIKKSEEEDSYLITEQFDNMQKDLFLNQPMRVVDKIQTQDDEIHEEEYRSGTFPSSVPKEMLENEELFHKNDPELTINNLNDNVEVMEVITNTEDSSCSRGTLQEQDIGEKTEQKVLEFIEISCDLKVDEIKSEEIETSRETEMKDEEKIANNADDASEYNVLEMEKVQNYEPSMEIGSIDEPKLEMPSISEDAEFYEQKVDSINVEQDLKEMATNESREVEELTTSVQDLEHEVLKESNPVKENPVEEYSEENLGKTEISREIFETTISHEEGKQITNPDEEHTEAASCDASKDDVPTKEEISPTNLNEVHDRENELSENNGTDVQVEGEKVDEVLELNHEKQIQEENRAFTEEEIKTLDSAVTKEIISEINSSTVEDDKICGSDFEEKIEISNIKEYVPEELKSMEDADSSVQTSTKKDNKTEEKIVVDDVLMSSNVFTEEETAEKSFEEKGLELSCEGENLSSNEIEKKKTHEEEAFDCIAKESIKEETLVDRKDACFAPETSNVLTEEEITEKSFEEKGYEEAPLKLSIDDENLSPSDIEKKRTDDEEAFESIDTEDLKEEILVQGKDRSFAPEISNECNEEEITEKFFEEKCYEEEPLKLNSEDENLSPIDIEKKKAHEEETFAIIDTESIKEETLVKGKDRCFSPETSNVLTEEEINEKSFEEKSYEEVPLKFSSEDENLSPAEIEKKTNDRETFDSIDTENIKEETLVEGKDACFALETSNVCIEEEITEKSFEEKSYKEAPLKLSSEDENLSPNEFDEKKTHKEEEFDSIDDTENIKEETLVEGKDSCFATETSNVLLEEKITEKSFEEQGYEEAPLKLRIEDENLSPSEIEKKKTDDEEEFDSIDTENIKGETNEVDGVNDYGGSGKEAENFREEDSGRSILDEGDEKYDGDEVIKSNQDENEDIEISKGEIFGELENVTGEKLISNEKSEDVEIHDKSFDICEAEEDVVIPQEHDLLPTKEVSMEKCRDYSTCPVEEVLADNDIDNTTQKSERQATVAEEVAEIEKVFDEDEQKEEPANFLMARESETFSDNDQTILAAEEDIKEIMQKDDSGVELTESVVTNETVTEVFSENAYKKTLAVEELQETETEACSDANTVVAERDIELILQKEEPSEEVKQLQLANEVEENPLSEDAEKETLEAGEDAERILYQDEPKEELEELLETKRIVSEASSGDAETIVPEEDIEKVLLKEETKELDQSLVNNENETDSFSGNSETVEIGKDTEQISQNIEVVEEFEKFIETEETETETCSDNPVITEKDTEQNLQKDETGDEVRELLLTSDHEAKAICEDEKETLVAEGDAEQTLHKEKQMEELDQLPETKESEVLCSEAEIFIPEADSEQVMLKEVGKELDQSLLCEDSEKETVITDEDTEKILQKDESKEELEQLLETKKTEIEALCEDADIIVAEKDTEMVLSDEELKEQSLETKETETDAFSCNAETVIIEKDTEKFLETHESKEEVPQILLTKDEAEDLYEDAGTETLATEDDPKMILQQEKSLLETTTTEIETKTEAHVAEKDIIEVLQDTETCATEEDRGKFLQDTETFVAEKDTERNLETETCTIEENTGKVLQDTETNLQTGESKEEMEVLQEIEACVSEKDIEEVLPKKELCVTEEETEKVLQHPESLVAEKDIQTNLQTYESKEEMEILQETELCEAEKDTEEVLQDTKAFVAERDTETNLQIGESKEEMEVLQEIEACVGEKDINEVLPKTETCVTEEETEKVLQYTESESFVAEKDIQTNSQTYELKEEMEILQGTELCVAEKDTGEVLQETETCVTEEATGEVLQETQTYVAEKDIETNLQTYESKEEMEVLQETKAFIAEEDTREGLQEPEAFVSEKDDKTNLQTYESKEEMQVLEETEACIAKKDTEEVLQDTEICVTEEDTGKVLQDTEAFVAEKDNETNSQMYELKEVAEKDIEQVCQQNETREEIEQYLEIKESKTEGYGENSEVMINERNLEVLPKEEPSEELGQLQVNEATKTEAEILCGSTERDILVGERGSEEPFEIVESSEKLEQLILTPEPAVDRGVDEYIITSIGTEETAKEEVIETARECQVNVISDEIESIKSQSQETIDDEITTENFQTDGTDAIAYNELEIEDITSKEKENFEEDTTSTLSSTPIIETITESSENENTDEMTLEQELQLESKEIPADNIELQKDLDTKEALNEEIHIEERFENLAQNLNSESKVHGKEDSMSEEKSLKEESEIKDVYDKEETNLGASNINFQAEKYSENEKDKDVSIVAYESENPIEYEADEKFHTTNIENEQEVTTEEATLHQIPDQEVTDFPAIASKELDIETTITSETTEKVTVEAAVEEITNEDAENSFKEQVNEIKLEQEADESEVQRDLSEMGPAPSEVPKQWDAESPPPPEIDRSTSEPNEIATLNKEEHIDFENQYEVVDDKNNLESEEVTGDDSKQILHEKKSEEEIEQFLESETTETEAFVAEKYTTEVLKDTEPYVAEKDTSASDEIDDLNKKELDFEKEYEVIDEKNNLELEEAEASEMEEPREQSSEYNTSNLNSLNDQYSTSEKPTTELGKTCSDFEETSTTVLEEETAAVEVVSQGTEHDGSMTQFNELSTKEVDDTISTGKEAKEETMEDVDTSQIHSPELTEINTFQKNFEDDGAKETNMEYNIEPEATEALTEQTCNEESNENFVASFVSEMSYKEIKEVRKDELCTDDYKSSMEKSESENSGLNVAESEEKDIKDDETVLDSTAMDNKQESELKDITDVGTMLDSPREQKRDIVEERDFIISSDVTQNDIVHVQNFPAVPSEEHQLTTSEGADIVHETFVGGEIASTYSESEATPGIQTIEEKFDKTAEDTSTEEGNENIVASPESMVTDQNIEEEIISKNKISIIYSDSPSAKFESENLSLKVTESEEQETQTKEDQSAMEIQQKDVSILCKEKDKDKETLEVVNIDNREHDIEETVSEEVVVEESVLTRSFDFTSEGNLQESAEIPSKKHQLITTEKVEEVEETVVRDEASYGNSEPEAASPIQTVEEKLDTKIEDTCTQAGNENLVASPESRELDEEIKEEIFSKEEISVDDSEETVSEEVVVEESVLTRSFNFTSDGNLQESAEIPSEKHQLITTEIVEEVEETIVRDEASYGNSEPEAASPIQTVEEKLDTTIEDTCTQAGNENLVASPESRELDEEIKEEIFSKEEICVDDSDFTSAQVESEDLSLKVAESEEQEIQPTEDLSAKDIKAEDNSIISTEKDEDTATLVIDNEERDIQETVSEEVVVEESVFTRSFDFTSERSLQESVEISADKTQLVATETAEEVNEVIVRDEASYGNSEPEATSPIQTIEEKLDTTVEDTCSKAGNENLVASPESRGLDEEIKEEILSKEEIFIDDSDFASAKFENVDLSLKVAESEEQETQPKEDCSAVDIKAEDISTISTEKDEDTETLVVKNIDNRECDIDETVSKEEERVLTRSFDFPSDGNIQESVENPLDKNQLIATETVEEVDEAIVRDEASSGNFEEATSPIQTIEVQLDTEEGIENIVALPESKVSDQEIKEEILRNEEICIDDSASAKLESEDLRLKNSEFEESETQSQEDQSAIDIKPENISIVSKEKDEDTETLVVKGISSSEHDFKETASTEVLVEENVLTRSFEFTSDDNLQESVEIPSEKHQLIACEAAEKEEEIYFEPEAISPIQTLEEKLDKAAEDTCTKEGKENLDASPESTVPDEEIKEEIFSKEEISINDYDSASSKFESQELSLKVGELEEQETETKEDQIAREIKPDDISILCKEKDEDNATLEVESIDSREHNMVVTVPTVVVAEENILTRSFDSTSDGNLLDSVQIPSDKDQLIVTETAEGVDETIVRDEASYGYAKPEATSTVQTIEKNLDITPEDTCTKEGIQNIVAFPESMVSDQANKEEILSEEELSMNDFVLVDERGELSSSPIDIRPEERSILKEKHVEESPIQIVESEDTEHVEEKFLPTSSDTLSYNDSPVVPSEENLLTAFETAEEKVSKSGTDDSPDNVDELEQSKAEDKVEISTFVENESHIMEQEDSYNSKDNTFDVGEEKPVIAFRDADQGQGKEAAEIEETSLLVEKKVEIDNSGETLECATELVDEGQNNESKLSEAEEATENNRQRNLTSVEQQSLEQFQEDEITSSQKDATVIDEKVYDEIRKTDSRESNEEQVIESKTTFEELHMVSSADDLNEVTQSREVSEDYVGEINTSEKVSTIKSEFEEDMTLERETTITETKNEEGVTNECMEKPVNISVSIAEESEEQITEEVRKNHEEIPSTGTETMLADSSFETIAKVAPSLSETDKPIEKPSNIPFEIRSQVSEYEPEVCIGDILSKSEDSDKGMQQEIAVTLLNTTENDYEKTVEESITTKNKVPNEEALDEDKFTEDHSQIFLNEEPNKENVTEENNEPLQSTADVYDRDIVNLSEVIDEHAADKKVADEHRMLKEETKKESFIELVKEEVTEVEHGIQGTIEDITQKEKESIVEIAPEISGKNLSQAEEIYDDGIKTRSVAGDVSLLVNYGPLSEPPIENEGQEHQNAKKEDKEVKEYEHEESNRDYLIEKREEESITADLGKVVSAEHKPSSIVENEPDDRTTAEKTEQAINKEELEDEKTGEADEEKHDTDAASDGPVIVEASKDIDVKVGHKKSHNILAGVGSKVKHSISKVKKAITGKSSHKSEPPK